MKGSMDLNIYYNFLIKIGQTDCLGEEDLMFYNKLTSKFKIPYKDELYDLFLLDDEEICLLFKGFIIIDNKTGPNGGSVSAGIQIYQDMTRRPGLDRSKLTMITDWSLRHAKNPYIPFGMSNRGSNLIDHVRKEHEYVKFLSEESLNAEINKMKKRFKGFENKINQLEKEKLYLRSIISEFNQEEVLEAQKRVISNKKKR